MAEQFECRLPIQQKVCRDALAGCLVEGEKQDVTMWRGATVRNASEPDNEVASHDDDDDGPLRLLVRGPPGKCTV